MTSNLSGFYWALIDEEGPVQKLSSLFNFETGEVTVENGKGRTVGEFFPLSTVVEIRNVELGHQF